MFRSQLLQVRGLRGLEHPRPQGDEALGLDAPLRAPHGGPGLRPVARGPRRSAQDRPRAEPLRSQHLTRHHDHDYNIYRFILCFFLSLFSFFFLLFLSPLLATFNDCYHFSALDVHHASEVGKTWSSSSPTAATPCPCSAPRRCCSTTSWPSL